MIRKSAVNIKCKEILHFCKVLDNDFTCGSNNCMKYHIKLVQFITCAYLCKKTESYEV